MPAWRCLTALEKMVRIFGEDRRTSPWVTGLRRLLYFLPVSIVLAWSVWATSQLMSLRADVAELIDAINATQQEITEYRTAFIDGMDAPPMGHGFKGNGKQLASGTGGF
jgi:hypothetical protein